ncbi:L-histidine N(alpha)-methyltransferase [Thalassoroseus pseudoceratinae]|uniref:L-histidine N(alpha)-methyltransferase n=1 Tax=Thalassoroseus pseudoceratinae TaxID=2713176 RepID=UPI0014240841|nr:L-histidine N(alpha)-methyltransferase [Thalassoroseus pseudoceratinae]
MSSHDLESLNATLDVFLSDVLEGLTESPKTLPSKYFYDETGSKLFDQICELDEYYLTRTELGIMRRHCGEMANAIGAGSMLIEYGSGSSLKTRMLLDALQPNVHYVPVDISGDYLYAIADRLRDRYPAIEIDPVCTDFTQPFKLPENSDAHHVVYFPGSTIGNFSPTEAVDLLSNIADQVGSGGGLLIGVDLWKSPELLHPAYSDSSGVTAEFNYNLLRRINSEFGADFEISQFQHEARVNAAEHRMESHLVSLSDQVVEIDGSSIEFAEGESIHTECSYKYTQSMFTEMAGDAGFDVDRVWRDEEKNFTVQYLVAR